jgi:negative regulator of PHO system
MSAASGTKASGGNSTAGAQLDFDLLHDLPIGQGQGTFGKVYVGMLRATSELVAIKRQRLDRQTAVDIERECRILSMWAMSPHAHVVRCYGAWVDVKRQATFVFEHCVMNLRQWVEWNSGIVSPLMVRLFARHLLLGTEAVHRAQIVHCDIKPPNLLLALDPAGDGRLVLKVADFGSARFLKGGEVCEGMYGAVPKLTPSPHIMTVPYRAPEVFLGSRTYSTAVDIWSVGVVIGELIVGKPLFWTEMTAMDNEVFETIINRLVGSSKVDELTTLPHWSKMTASLEAAPGNK